MPSWRPPLTQGAPQADTQDGQRGPPGEEVLAGALAINSGFVGSSSSTDVGGTVGGGLEWAAHDGWTLKTEYLYYDLGGRTVAGNHFNNPAPPQFGADAHYDTQGHIVRVGVNYRLGGH